jgi:hypothetical protein
MTILLYEAAIRQLCGDELLPLNTIRDRYPDLYDRESAKYAERPYVMDHPVHPLGCRWTDVVFFSPVHPELIFEALRESGRISGAPDYWTIDANLLSPDRTCILLKRHDPLPWADIPHILHRGPVPVALFRTPNGDPVCRDR